MGKSLSFLSLLALVFTGIGASLVPSSPVFWLATSSNTLQVLRFVLGLLIVAQLATRPPRHLLFRVLAGALAAGIGCWTMAATYSNSMQILDSLALLGGSIAVLITALERKATQLAHHSAAIIHVPVKVIQ